MKNIQKLMLIQMGLAVFILLLIILLFLNTYINHLPNTEVTLENTTILGNVVDIIK